MKHDKVSAVISLREVVCYNQLLSSKSISSVVRRHYEFCITGYKNYVQLKDEYNIVENCSFDD